MYSVAGMCLQLDYYSSLKLPNDTTRFTIKYKNMRNGVCWGKGLSFWLIIFGLIEKKIFFKKNPQLRQFISCSNLIHTQIWKSFELLSLFCLTSPSIANKGNGNLTHCSISFTVRQKSLGMFDEATHFESGINVECHLCIRGLTQKWELWVTKELFLLLNKTRIQVSFPHKEYS